MIRFPEYSFLRELTSLFSRFWFIIRRGGHADRSYSAHCYLTNHPDQENIDWFYLTFFNQRNHCERAAEIEIWRGLDTIELGRKCSLTEKVVKARQEYIGGQ